MTAELLVLGGAEEIGANCTYLGFDRTGILIDAGLHPKDRSAGAFPDVDALGLRQADALVITHAHNDHMGGLPYVMRRLPHVRAIMTHATRDLSHVMLHNTAKLLKTDIRDHLPKESLEFYKKDTIELLRHAFEAFPYEEPFDITGYSGDDTVRTSLHWSGHILGSASVLMDWKGLRVLHTGDVQFDNQSIVQKARTPRSHVDVLIMESTNGATERLNDVPHESKRLANFINTVTTANGSVLIPTFALGKTQEVLRVLWGLMQRGSIPQLPIFTAGMGLKINKIYDQYCYTEPMRQPGFEVSDIPQQRIIFDELYTGPYFKHPSIVLVSSGMMNKGTLSHALALQWMQKPNFGIAFIGYQDPDAPGYALLNSLPGVPFEFGQRTVRRVCHIERLRFSAHASLDGLLGFVMDVRPGTAVLMHGSVEACDHLALCIKERLPGTRVLIPRRGIPYRLSKTGTAVPFVTLPEDEE